ncbi:hypothetical protein DL766_008472 [Monosporascus sp. MC13-8B]|uniref:NmrA-like domain-containing protein n=1 Tax=Monosporascus cannonballus TaxID=155416 RepID=A0ABY0GWP6_9PEZI|nr:hypothetical protein DL762_008345 [Monosporascus cannonballus]RYO95849.1 hypothetical protein DL763_003483 [Monosporascus cannonballus]RYP19301.1 hypothetical protein DL766_008472 [Monosporascus sp. MC13-8B]
MSNIENVAIIGASGSLGSVVFEKLVASGKFHVRVLKRVGSSSKFPSGTEVVEVDFDSLDSLKSALSGQDALVSTVSSSGLESQKTLIDAAIATGVKRFIPSEFGSDLDNPNARKLPVYRQKVAVQEYLIEKAKSTGITYTIIYNCAFLDWALKHKFILDVSSDKPTIIDGGNKPFSTTTLSTAADAVLGVFGRLEETKNRGVYIQDAVITQNQVLEMAKKAAPNRSRDVVHVKLDDLTAEADAKLAKGDYSMGTFVPYLYRAILDPAYGGNFTGKTDNELLGIKEMSEAGVFEVVKSFV